MNGILAYYARRTRLVPSDLETRYGFRICVSLLERPDLVPVRQHSSELDLNLPLGLFAYTFSRLEPDPLFVPILAGDRRTFDCVLRRLLFVGPFDFSASKNLEEEIMRKAGIRMNQS